MDLKSRFRQYILLFFYGLVAGQGFRSLPDAFSTHFSAYNGESELATNTWLSYDKTKNKASLNSEYGVAIFNFADEEYLVIDGTQCESDKLADVAQFPFSFTNQNREEHEIASPDVLFHLDGEHVVISPDVVLDGISTQHWKSNKTILHSKVTENCTLEHWFQNDNTPCANEKECYITLLKMEITCLENEPSFVFRFYNFDPSPPPNEAFQQPLGVFCFDRKADDLPRAPARFMFASEMLSAETANPKYVARRQLEYWYDRDFQLLRLRQHSNNNKRNTETYFDYRKGISYTNDLDTGKCTIMDINESLPTGEDVLWQTMKMEKRRFQYAGQRTLNGIEFYIWAWSSANNSLISDSEVKNLYYVKESVPESDVFRYLPVFQETYTIKDGKVKAVIHDKLSSDEMTPSIWSSQDVSACFQNPGQTLIFGIEITPQTRGSDGGISPSLVSLFKEGVHGQLLGAMGISPLRLNKMQIVHFEEGDVWMSAVLTENPNLLGFGKKELEPNLIDAYTKLETSISNDKFQFHITEPTTKKNYSFKATRIQEIKHGGVTFLKAKILKGKKPLSL